MRSSQHSQVVVQDSGRPGALPHWRCDGQLSVGSGPVTKLWDICPPIFHCIPGLDVLQNPQIVASFWLYRRLSPARSCSHLLCLTPEPGHDGAELPSHASGNRCMHFPAKRISRVSTRDTGPGHFHCRRGTMFPHGSSKHIEDGGEFLPFRWMSPDRRAGSGFFSSVYLCSSSVMAAMLIGLSRKQLPPVKWGWAVRVDQQDAVFLVNATVVEYISPFWLANRWNRSAFGGHFYHCFGKRQMARCHLAGKCLACCG